MLCCGICGNMSKRDYKVSQMDGIELEPLGGPKSDQKTNGVKYGGGDSSGGGRQTRNGVAVCSQKRAFCVTTLVVGSLLTTALIIAYAGPQNDCACAGKMPPGYVMDHENSSAPFNPIATNGEPFPWLEPVLPTFVRPTRYMLTVHPNLTTLDVKGQVTIELYVEKETSFIVLHIQDLNITEKAIVGPKGSAIKINRILEYPPRQQLYIELKDVKLKKKSNYTLNLRWYSKLVPEPEGFYVDQYESITREQRLLAATVFRPSGARKAFPCFDEPHLRAPFRVSVFRDRFHIGLSNSIVHATDDVGFYMGTGLLRDDFIETPPLPADAVAWVVSDFQRESLQASSTYQVATTATPPLLTRTAHVKTQNSDNFTFRTDKKPVRNVTALTHSLNLHLMIKNTTTTSTSAAVKSKNITSLSQSAGGPIKKAPSYTFYAPRDLLPRSTFILKTSRDVLEYLQTWLEVAYPLSKVDFVALPSLDRDMISSLGLITMRSSFLTDPGAITTEEYHTSAIKVAEAIVKQFFGGIASPRVWKDIWLWEGLIRYLGSLVLTPLQSSWPMQERHLLHLTSKALDVDALERWESIINGTNPNGMNEEFYVEKTASIFSMLHTAIGEESFRSCLGTFLKNNKYKTAEPVDMWNTCTKKANGSKNIKEMMSLWTMQPGFPLLTVTKVGSSVSISQKEFEFTEYTGMLYEPYETNFTTTTSTTTTTVAPPHKNRTKQLRWVFPVTYITNIDNISDTLWFTSTDLTFQIHADVKWIKVNSEQNGYYRVLYNEDNWVNLIEDLKMDHEIFGAKDRVGLVSDAFTLCHANLLPCEITMNLITYLPKERNWGPMTTALKHLERWRRILKYSECFLMLSEFVKSILLKPINDFDWVDNGSDETRLVRPEVLLASILWEDTDSIGKAKNILHQYLTNGTVIPPNLKEVVYTGSILSGEYIYWQYCWGRFISLRGTPEGQVERIQLLRALGKTKDAWLQNRLLSHVTMLPTAEVVQVLQAISGTPTGGAMACRFLQAKWYELQSKLGAGSINFAKVISAITQYGATRFDYDELKSLVHRFGGGPGMRVLNMTLSSVSANVEWVAKSQQALYSWVESNGSVH